MPVEAISLRTGLELPAAIADFDTYIDELPRCSKCFGELCLAKGEKRQPLWRHFPGVGNECPDKSEMLTNNLDIIFKAFLSLNKLQGFMPKKSN